MLSHKTPCKKAALLCVPTMAIFSWHSVPCSLLYNHIRKQFYVYIKVLLHAWTCTNISMGTALVLMATYCYTINWGIFHCFHIGISEHTLFYNIWMYIIDKQTGLMYLTDHRSTDCKSMDRVIYTFICNKYNDTDRLYLFPTVFLSSSSNNTTAVIS